MPGYAVAGKTGTAEKPRKGGGYDSDKVINTFASIFPANDPKYVLIVTLDEPVETSGPKPRRTAGWTAVPVAAEIIRRIAPLMGLRPQVDVAKLDGLTAVSAPQGERVTMTTAKKLSALGLTARAGRDPVLTGVTLDSRAVRPGFLFAAMPGTAVHGATYIPTALERRGRRHPDRRHRGQTGR